MSILLCSDEIIWEGFGVRKVLERCTSMTGFSVSEAQDFLGWLSHFILVALAVWPQLLQPVYAQWPESIANALRYKPSNQTNSCYTHSSLRCFGYEASNQD